MSTLALSSRALAGQPSWPGFGAGCLTYEITDLGGSFHTPEPQVAGSSKEMEGETLNPRLHGQPGLHSSPLTVPSSCALPVGTVQNVLGFRMVLGWFQHFRDATWVREHDGVFVWDTKHQGSYVLKFHLGRQWSDQLHSGPRNQVAGSRL